MNTLEEQISLTQHASGNRASLQKLDMLRCNEMMDPVSLLSKE
jgi:hypothetical protein